MKGVMLSDAASFTKSSTLYFDSMASALSISESSGTCKCILEKTLRQDKIVPQHRHLIILYSQRPIFHQISRLEGPLHFFSEVLC